MTAFFATSVIFRLAECAEKSYNIRQFFTGRVPGNCKE